MAFYSCTTIVSALHYTNCYCYIMLREEREKKCTKTGKERRQKEKETLQTDSKYGWQEQIEDVS